MNTTYYKLNFKTNVFKLFEHMKKTAKTPKVEYKLIYTLVTGASAGIGEATALELASFGTPLVLMARRRERLNKVKTACLKLGSPEVQVVTFDQSRPKSIEAAVKTIEKKKWAIRNLINSAGLARGTGHVQDSQLRDIDEMLDTNVKGVFHLTRGLLKTIIKEQGHIVNLGSVAGRLVYEGGTVYCATKFAIRAFSDGLRMDLKGTGVRVTNIEPGMVNTEFSRVRLGSQQKANKIYENMMPLSATDVAQSVLWCLRQPAHVNIQELVIYPTDQASVGQIVRGEKSIKNLEKYS